MKDSFKENLERATIEGNLPQLQALLETYGAQAIRNDRDLQELTTLHIAASAGHLEVVRFLLSDEVNADPLAARINNFTPLHAAAMDDRAIVCDELLLAGANVNAQTEPQGYTPLHSAAFGGHLQTVKVLIFRRADTELRNYRNERPIDTARRQNQTEVVKFFEEIEATPLRLPPIRPVGELTWIAGGEIDECSVSLLFFGDDLDPDRITESLGIDPTKAARRGDIIRYKTSDRLQKIGRWSYRVPKCAEIGLEEKIDRLFDLLPADLDLWQELTTAYTSDLFCGLWSKRWNRELYLSPKILKKIADRGLSLYLDIYFNGEDEAE